MRKYVTAIYLWWIGIRCKMILYRRICWNRLTKKSKMGLPLPEEVNLCGILYRVQEHENLIVFSQLINFWGDHNRIAFTKDKYSSWYVELKSGYLSDKMSACRILAAYRLVCDYRGDDFGRDMAKDGSI